MIPAAPRRGPPELTDSLPMSKLAAVAERLLLTLWVGAQWGIGYLAAPILFANLDDRHLAGTLAGHMFVWLDLFGAIACLILLAIAWTGRSGRAGGSRVWALLLLLAIIAVEELVFHPRIAALREAGIPDGSAAAAHFAWVHGGAQVLYLVASLVGLWLAAVGVRKPVAGE